MTMQYDISVLGHAMIDQRARTGVYRVIISVLRQLQQRGFDWVPVSLIGNFHECTLFLQAEQPGMVLAPWSAVDPFLMRAAVTLGRLWQKLPPKFYKIVSFVQRRVFYCIRLLSPLAVMGAARPLHCTFVMIPTGLRRRQRGALIVTIYDLIPVKYKQWMPKSWRRHPVHRLIDSLQPQDWVLCISQATKNDLLAYAPQLRADHVAVMPLGVSDHFHPCVDADAMTATRAKYGISGRYILSLCTLEPRKNIRHLILCFQSWLQRFDAHDVQLVLSGGKGWSIDDLFRDVGGLDPAMKRRIIITGYIDDADMSPLYSGADFFVYPSLYEGFGLPPLEAMACGTPVITSDNSSLPEVVADAGVMVPAADAEALLTAMQTLYADAALRDEYRRRGLVRAAQFTWDACADVVLSTYRQAMDEAPHA